MCFFISDGSSAQSMMPLHERAVIDPGRRKGMRLTNDSYLISLHAGNGVERYYRDGLVWIKVSTRGRKFKATAEQVLNHLIPALAGVNQRVSASVEHRDLSETAARTLEALREPPGQG